MVEKGEHKCVNCNAVLHGKFCHDCGQKMVLTEDKTVRHYLTQFFSSLFFADGKFLKTFKTLLIKPGEISRTFIAGNRKKYLSPLQFFFFANLLYFIFPVLSTFNTNLTTQMNGLPYSSIVKEVVIDHVEKKGIEFVEFRQQYEKKSTENGKLLLISLVFMQAILLKGLFYKRKNLFFTDFLASSAYFNGFYIITLLVIFPSIILLLNTLFDFDWSVILNESILSIVLLGTIVWYLYFLIKRAFEASKIEAVIKSILLALFLIPTFVVYRFILFWVTFWMVS